MTVIQDNESSQAEPEGRGFLSRFFRALFRAILFVLLVTVLAFLGWLGIQELQRSFNALDARVDRQSEQVGGLQARFDSQGERVAELEQTVDGQAEELAALSGDLTEQAGRQDELLATLTEQVNGLISGTETLSRSLALLDGEQVAFREDLDGYGGELAALGGDVSTLQTEQAAAAEGMAAFEAELTAAAPADLRQAVLAFRVWQLVSRARLHLAEDNPGLAADDVDMAQAALATLLFESDAAQRELLEPVETRLQLAAGSLPDSPTTARNDLDNAWQQLDAILGDLLGTATLPPPADATPEATPEAAP